MSYCVKCIKHTKNVNENYKTSKNGKLMLKSTCSICGSKKSQFVKGRVGSGVDIHKMICKIPRPKAGFTPSKYKYMGPYNPLDKQLEYDKETGQITKWHIQPLNKVDEISAARDVCYSMGKNKGDCDRQMVKSLDQIPYGEMPKWGQVARFLINTKQKLGMGVKSKNGKSRRVKKTGKKN